MSEAEVVCAQCNQPVGDDVEEVDGLLVCARCGTVVGGTDQELVHQSLIDEDGRTSGVRVAHNDSGTIAASLHLERTQRGHSSNAFRSTDARVRAAAERTSAAASALNLSVATCAAVSDTLHDAQQHYEQMKAPITGATLAAVVYAAARSCDVPLSLAAAGAAFEVRGVTVGREYRRLAQRLELALPPPTMRALVLRNAGVLLPHYCLGASAGSLLLPQHAVVRNALALAELLGPQGLSAYDGYSHRVAAVAILYMCLQAYLGAGSGGVRRMRAADVADLAQLSRITLSAHIGRYQQELLTLSKLLPFAGDATKEDVASYAPVLLQLYKLTQRVKKPAQATAGAPAPPSQGVASS